jgi:glycosyltransferase involved in cell wall biosynthesis
MKRALILANTAGFIITFLQNDIKILQSMGYEVDCAGDASYKNKEENDETFLEFGCKFYQIDMDAKKPLSMNNLKAYKQVKKLIKSGDYSVIHCHTPVAGFLGRIAARAKRRTGTRVIYSTHGFAFHKLSGKKSWLVFYTIEKCLSLFSDAIITINTEDYENAKRMFAKRVYHINGVGLDSNKFINCVIDRDEYRKCLGIESDKLMILSVGELSERKNHQVIIKAIGKAGIDNVVYAICGKAMQGQGTHDRLQTLAKENHVDLMFLGHRVDIPEVCHCADIGAIPSTREGLGMSGLEMLASGIPVIGSNVQGIRDYIIDGVNGFLVDPFDVDGFADAIRRLAVEEKRNEMRKNCVDSIRDFDISVSHSQMNKIFEEVLQ